MKINLLLLCAATILTPSFSNHVGFIPENDGYTTEDIKFNSAKKSVSTRTIADHPTVAGFQFVHGDTKQVLSTEPTGYFHYDTDIYYSQFTTTSRLYLIHVRSNFTSGSEAVLNDNSYDWHYDLWSGYIHVSASQKNDGAKRSSSLQYVKSWPVSSSSDMTCDVTSSFGVNYTISNDIQVGASLNEGATITAKRTNGFSIGFQQATTIHGKEPSINAEKAPDQNADISYWSYQFHEPYKGSYQMDCYYMFEVSNDSAGYESYSFNYSIDIKMTNIAWKGYIWQQLKDTTTNVSSSFGI